MENNGVVILGGDAQAEAPVAEKKEGVVILGDEPKKTEVPTTEAIKETKAEDVKPISEKEVKKEETPSDKKEVKTEKPEIDERKPLEISFDNQKPTPKEVVKKSQETAPLTITDDVVRDYLSKNHGVSVEKLTNLSEKVVLSEQVKAFKQFNDETDGTVADFYTIQKDWSKVADNELLEAYYRKIDPNLSIEDVKDQIDLITVSEEDELNDDDRTLRQRKIDYARVISKAKSFMGDFQKKYKVSLEKSQKVKPLTAEEITKQHEPYWAQRNKSLEKMTDIKMNIKGLGEIIIPIEETDRNLVAKNTQTLDAFIERFKNKDGSMNTEKTVKGTLYSDEGFFQRAIQAVAEQVHALTLENFSKENRNVTLGKHKKNTNINKDDGGLVTINRGTTESFAPKAVI